MQREVDILEKQRQWLLNSATIQPRPLEVLATEEDDDRQLREMIGASGYDAIRLTEHLDGILYTDDLGLRRLDFSQPRVRSCSTITLLGALSERGLLSADHRDAKLTRLIEWHYEHVMPTPELLTYVLRHAAGLPHATVSRVFGTLGLGSTTIGEAVAILIETLRRHSIVGVMLVSIYEATTLGLAAMSKTWPKAQVVRAVVHEATSRLALLPQAHRDCLRACKDFLSDNPSVR